MIEFSDWDILRNLLIATQWTVLLSLAAFVCGTAVALALTAMRLTRNPAMMRIVKIYVELFQGTPLLMQMFLCFFGLSMIGIRDFCVGCRDPILNPIHQCLFSRNLARLYRHLAQGAMGS